MFDLCRARNLTFSSITTKRFVVDRSSNFWIWSLYKLYCDPQASCTECDPAAIWNIDLWPHTNIIQLSNLLFLFNWLNVASVLPNLIRCCFFLYRTWYIEINISYHLLKAALHVTVKWISITMPENIRNVIHNYLEIHNTSIQYSKLSKMFSSLTERHTLVNTEFATRFFFFLNKQRKKFTNIHTAVNILSHFPEGFHFRFC